MTTGTDELQARSEHCRANAAKAPNDDFRRQYLMLAEMWADLAKQRWQWLRGSSLNRSSEGSEIAD